MLVLNPGLTAQPVPSTARTEVHKDISVPWVCLLDERAEQLEIELAVRHVTVRIAAFSEGLRDGEPLPLQSIDLTPEHFGDELRDV